MKRYLNIAAGICLGSTVAWAFIHRRAIAATITGSELPTPPAWHAKRHRAAGGSCGCGCK